MTGPFGYIKAPDANNGATMHELVDQAAESAATAKATITPIPNGGLTRRWRAYVIFSAIWLVAAIVSLFAGDDTIVHSVSHGIAYLAVIILAFWVLRPPVKYQEATK